MKKILMRLSFLAVALTGLMASCQTTQPQTSQPKLMQVTSPSNSQIDQLYVFGDSLSDAGNVFRVTEGTYPPTPPYFQGRYSNGRVWVEQLATKLGLSAERTNNFAYGGATTANARENGIPGVLVQIQNFVKTNPQGDPKALYVVWGGANDYLGGGETNPTRVVENITMAIESLSKTGAKRFLVANLPDLGILPATRNTSAAKSLSSLSQSHNATLSRSLEALNQKLGNETQIFALDVSRLYQTAIATPSKFGLKNVTNACLNNTACKPSEFLFWDGIHPTTKTHQLLAETAFSTLQKPAQVSANP